MTDQLLTLKEVLVIFQCSRRTFYNDTNRFPTPIRFGRGLRFRREDVEAKLQELAQQGR